MKEKEKTSNVEIVRIAKAERERSKQLKERTVQNALQFNRLRAQSELAILKHQHQHRRALSVKPVDVSDLGFIEDDSEATSGNT